MKLRLRLALSTLAIAAPVLGGFAWLHTYSRSRALMDALGEHVLVRMQNGERERCEATPAIWTGIPAVAHKAHNGAWGRPLWARPARLYAYDELFHAQSPDAPPLDATLLAAMTSGQASAGRRFALDGHPTYEVLVKMPWTGPCAVVLARQDIGIATSWRGALPPLQAWAVPVPIVLLAVLLGLGPIVGRIRKLTHEIRQSAQQRYGGAISIKGRDEIAELARAFEQASGEIRVRMASQQRRELALRTFLENTMHDVMIPLTVLQGHLDTAKQAVAAGRLLEEGVVSSAIQEVHYMASLLHNLHIAAQLEAGEPQVQRALTNLNDVVARATGRHLPIAKQKQVALESSVPERPITVLADVTLVEQAVSNVVYNAIRYNRRDGHAAVILEAAGPHDFRIRIFDDGPGIPEAELARLCERRFRGNGARTREANGQGIGLNITYRVAELHGWTLVLGKSEFGGLAVELSGPLAEGAAASYASPA